MYLNKNSLIMNSFIYINHLVEITKMNYKEVSHDLNIIG